MIHRLRKYLQEARSDFWVIGCHFGWYHVSPETGREIAEMLERRKPPRWVYFVDLHGSEVRVLSETIVRVEQSLSDQRQLERAFYKALREEEEPEKPPEDQWA